MSLLSSRGVAASLLPRRRSGPVGGPEVVDSTTATVASANITLDVPDDTEDGDLLVVHIASAVTVAFLTVPDGWALAVPNGVGGTNLGSIRSLVLWRIADDEPSSYTFGNGDGNSHHTGQMLTIRGHGGIDAFHSDLDASTLPDPQPVGGTGIILGLWGVGRWNQTASWTAPTEMTTVENVSPLINSRPAILSAVESFDDNEFTARTATKGGTVDNQYRVAVTVAVRGPNTSGVGEVEHIADGTLATSTSGTTLDVDIPAHDEGDLLLLRVVSADQGGVQATPAGWTMIDRASISSGQRLTYRKVGDGSTGTVTVTNLAGSTRGKAGLVSAYRGEHGTPRVVGFSRIQGSGVAGELSLAPPALDVVDGDLFAGTWHRSRASSSTDLWTLPAGMTQRVRSFIGGGSVDRCWYLFADESPDTESDFVRTSTHDPDPTISSESHGAGAVVLRTES